MAIKKSELRSSIWAACDELRGGMGASFELADMPDFNDSGKLGSGKEMVDRLTSQIAIFQNPALDFSRNRADGDDILGDAYEYLRKYWLATQHGICSTEIWPLVPDSARLVPGYLFAVVQTDDLVQAASVAFGTHMPRADWGVVRGFEIALPGLQEQAAIAQAVSDMDAELAALEARHDKTRLLKLGVMQELLTGKTRLAPHA